MQCACRAVEAFGIDKKSVGSYYTNCEQHRWTSVFLASLVSVPNHADELRSRPLRGYVARMIFSESMGVFWIPQFSYVFTDIWTLAAPLVIYDIGMVTVEQMTGGPQFTATPLCQDIDRFEIASFRSDFALTRDKILDFCCSSITAIIEMRLPMRISHSSLLRECQ